MIGPRVSLGSHTVVTNSNIDNSLIQENSEIHTAHLTNSMIGNFAKYKGKNQDISLGDFSTINFSK